jgi:hypothetical protein
MRQEVLMTGSGPNQPSESLNALDSVSVAQLEIEVGRVMIVLSFKN